MTQRATVLEGPDPAKASTLTRVMVVDDSLMVRQHVGQALCAAGFSIVEACDGVEALCKLDAGEKLSLIVLDVNMPNMNGIELLERMKASSIAIPVVMLTTEGQPHLMHQARALGARGWIIKPFRPELLLAAVRKLTRAT